MNRCAVRSLYRACAVVGLAALVAAPAVAQIRVIDDTGASVVLAAPARRIVTLAPHATELVYAAGAGASIVGVSKGSAYPPAARSAGVQGVVRVLVDARSLAGIADDVERIGALAGTEAEATSVVRSLRERIARLDAAHAKAPPLRVFYQLSDVPLFTLGGHHLISQAIAHCGGRNVFAGLSLPAPQVSVEAVLAANPEVIVAGTDDAKRPAWLDRWTRWPALDAVREHRLYVVDANLLHRPGPRFIDGVAQLCDALSAARRQKAAVP